MRTPLRHRAFCTLLCGALVCVGQVPALSSPAAGKKPTPVVARIERVAVESSSLVSMGFAKDARVLEIEFHSGAIYRYFAVPPAVFEGFKRAESKGRYFAQTIRGKYEFQRVAAAAK